MNHLLALFFSPHQAWERIRDQDDSILLTYVKFVIPIALLPAFAGISGLFRSAGKWVTVSSN